MRAEFRERSNSKKRENRLELKGNELELKIYEEDRTLFKRLKNSAKNGIRGIIYFLPFGAVGGLLTGTSCSYIFGEYAEEYSKNKEIADNMMLPIIYWNIIGGVAISSLVGGTIGLLKGFIKNKRSYY